MAEGKRVSGGNRLLAERPLPGDAAGPRRGAPTRPRLARSVTVNLAESPLGWLHARGLLSDAQLAAGERLRADWERAQLAHAVTMDWHAAPPGRGRRSAPVPSDPALGQIAARRRFDAAVAAAGPGLSDILWRVVCAGEGMREAEQALGWPVRAGRLVLTLALDRLVAHYRIG
ncbi:MAG: DUF6456 domain-containing protein [Allosphingosinicella sp.]|uniref:DUF6456 domain-containing protein n=1 Tax=Allosphingosinicella sp. TaxID=2823234 RepID=UPI00393DA981